MRRQILALTLLLSGFALGEDVITQEACQTFMPYCRALQASGVKVYGTGLYIGDRLFVNLPDQRAADTFLEELRQRGLDPARVELMLSPTDQLPEPSHWPDAAQVVVQPTAEGYDFTMTMTHHSLTPVTYQPHYCEPAYIERVADGERVWQAGTGFCPAVGSFPVTLKLRQSVSRSVQWDGKNSLNQRVAPGLYRIRMGLGPFVGETVFRMH